MSDILTKGGNMILITGGAGYIGSHLTLRVLSEFYDVIVYDNLSNSTMRNLNVINKHSKRINNFYFVNGDIRDELKLERIFKKYVITKVVHLAGLKSINDSFKYANDYHNVNFLGSEIILRLAIKYNVQTIVFSSTAAVYDPLPIGRYNETMSASGLSSPYSTSKINTEYLLHELKGLDVTTDIVILRYFNPVGVDLSGYLIEENTTSQNLFPAILTSLKKDEFLNVYGDDYVTFDGTAIRDYVHIDDLIDVHMLMINDKVLSDSVRVFNVGSDTGYSVKEVINEFNRQIDQPVKVAYRPRRKGDVQQCVADITKLKKFFNWSPKYNLEDMIRSVIMNDHTLNCNRKDNDKI